MGKAVNDLAAAKAKKQKKIAIIGGILLLGLLAFQGPRTLKMLHRQSATAAPAPVAPAAPAPATPVPGAVPATGTVTPVTAQLGADSLVVNADLSPAPLDGQLPDLTAFTTKDPFVQKGPDAKSAGSASTGGTNAGKAKPKSDTGKSLAPGNSGSSSPSSPQPVPASAQISVNGAAETVTKGDDFPKAPPPGTAVGLFHLVSLTAKTAKISIAGGSLTSGDAAVTLTVGKPLTLMNTADGTRYVILLVSVGAAPASSTTTMTTTSTAASPTSTTPAAGG